MKYEIPVKGLLTEGTLTVHISTSLGRVFVNLRQEFSEVLGNRFIGSFYLKLKSTCTLRIYEELKNKNLIVPEKEDTLLIALDQAGLTESYAYFYALATADELLDEVYAELEELESLLGEKDDEEDDEEDYEDEGETWVHPKPRRFMPFDKRLK